MLGTNLLFTFVLEEDFASSSNRIGAILTRMHGNVSDLATLLKSAPPASRIIVCEDALWTGSEFKKILMRLAVDGDLYEHARNKSIRFRYCVVCDYGLWVGRHYLSTNNQHNNIDFLLDERQRAVQVLDCALNEEQIRAHWSLSPKDFDDWLSGKVKPLAFQDQNLWRGRQIEAQEICERIGTQLLERYDKEHSKGWTATVREGFALGAGRIGGTLLFAHSVPKVCLPLFWLGGDVRHNSILVDWKPLFFDARRTGKSEA